METLTDFLAKDGAGSSQAQEMEGGVGYLSVHVPEEIIIAAGKVPYRIFGTGFLGLCATLCLWVIVI